jgi:hypothetical protein
MKEKLINVVLLVALLTFAWWTLVLEKENTTKKFDAVMAAGNVTITVKHKVQEETRTGPEYYLIGTKGEEFYVDRVTYMNAVVGSRVTFVCEKSSDYGRVRCPDPYGEGNNVHYSAIYLIVVLNAVLFSVFFSLRKRLVAKLMRLGVE